MTTTTAGRLTAAMTSNDRRISGARPSSSCEASAKSASPTAYDTALIRLAIWNATKYAAAAAAPSSLSTTSGMISCGARFRQLAT